MQLAQHAETGYVILSLSLNAFAVGGEKTKEDLCLLCNKCIMCGLILA